MLPLTTSFAGHRYITRDPDNPRRRMGTPLLSALIAVAAADVVFALNSIPATFAITTDPFVVVSANAFAVLGLRPLYFLLAGALDRFAHLSVGLAVVLVFIGAKMVLADVAARASGFAPSGSDVVDFRPTCHLFEILLVPGLDRFEVDSGHPCLLTRGRTSVRGQRLRQVPNVDQWVAVPDAVALSRAEFCPTRC